MISQYIAEKLNVEANTVEELGALIGLVIVTSPVWLLFFCI